MREENIIEIKLSNRFEIPSINFFTRNIVFPTLTKRHNTQHISMDMLGIVLCQIHKLSIPNITSLK